MMIYYNIYYLATVSYLLFFLDLKQDVFKTELFYVRPTFFLCDNVAWLFPIVSCRVSNQDESNDT